MPIEVSTFGEVLAQQAVGVLVRAALPAADQANASQADPPGLTFSVSVSASQHLIIEVLRRPVEFTVRAGDLLFLLNDDAELIVARASRAGFEPFRRYTVSDSATWAQPAISGSRLFVKDVSTLALWTLD